MSHLSDEDDNGKTLTQVKYSWTDQNELHVNIRATLTRPSVVDISNCYLFNLAGHVYMYLQFIHQYFNFIFFHNFFRAGRFIVC